MIQQTLKGWSLFLSFLFVIMAVSNYFGSGKVYPVLISVSFIIYLIGEVGILVLDWRMDRRKQDLGAENRKPWFLKRQTD